MCQVLGRSAQIPGVFSVEVCATCPLTKLLSHGIIEISASEERSPGDHNTLGGIMSIDNYAQK